MTRRRKGVRPRLDSVVSSVVRKVFVAMFYRQRLKLCLLVGLFTVVLVSAARGESCLTASDREAVRQLHEAYRIAWLANDEAAVRKTFTNDAVLLPPHALEPVVGMEAIKRFWWPQDGPPTTITRFEAAYDEIGGCGTIAYARGRSEVEWTVEDHGKSTKFHNTGRFLTLFRKLPDGAWKISHQMWDDPPNPPR